MQVDGAYRELAVDEKAELISAEQALESVINKIDSIITSDQYTIKDIQLRYVPEYTDKEHKNLRLVPAWCFYMQSIIIISEKSDIPFTSNHVIKIDAQDGSEIY